VTFSKTFNKLISGIFLTGGEFLIHFPVPMTRAWDNVTFTCSLMLLFRSSSDLDDWCNLHSVKKGDMRKVKDFWPFAKKW